MNAHDWWRIVCSSFSSSTSFKIPRKKKARPKKKKTRKEIKTNKLVWIFQRNYIYIYVYRDNIYCLASSCVPFSTQREELHCPALINGSPKGPSIQRCMGRRYLLETEGSLAIAWRGRESQVLQSHSWKEKMKERKNKAEVAKTSTKLNARSVMSGFFLERERERTSFSVRRNGVPCLIGCWGNKLFFRRSIEHLGFGSAREQPFSTFSLFLFCSDSPVLCAENSIKNAQFIGTSIE